MEKLKYGRYNQLIFLTKEEKFKTIGFLCNNNNCTITIEDNATRGSYTDAYRIKIKRCYDELTGLNDATRNSNRVNCNEFIIDLLNDYGFVCDDDIHVFGIYSNVQVKIPSEFVKDFDDGYNY